MRFSEHTNRNCRRAFTMLDVLISLSIIGLLFGLLLPSIQQARESARILQCANNLRQLGLSAEQHVAIHRRFPYTSTQWYDGVKQHKAISPHRYLMAALDPQVFSQINFDDPTSASWTSIPVFAAANNQKLSAQSLAVLNCPSDQTYPGSNSYRASLGISVELLPSRGNIESDSQRGAFVNGRAVAPAEFTHGLSNTVLFSERVTGDFKPTVYEPFRDVFAGTDLNGYRTTADMESRCRASATVNPASHYSWQGASWLLGGYSNTWFNHVRVPNSRDPDCAAGRSWTDGGPSIIAARSLHSDGVNSLFGDGSSRFISFNIDQSVWRALGTRTGSPD